jgi:hypothetical protein
MVDVWVGAVGVRNLGSVLGGKACSKDRGLAGCLCDVRRGDLEPIRGRDATSPAAFNVGTGTGKRGLASFHSCSRFASASRSILQCPLSLMCVRITCSNSLRLRQYTHV